jgi:hypothetical protein
MQTRIARVVLETPRYRIIGELTLPSEGSRSRVSDLLNRQDVGFIPLVNAEMSPTNGGDPMTRGFVAVARSHVEIAYELDE